MGVGVGPAFVSPHPFRRGKHVSAQCPFDPYTRCTLPEAQRRAIQSVQSEVITVGSMAHRGMGATVTKRTEVVAATATHRPDTDAFGQFCTVSRDIEQNPVGERASWRVRIVDDQDIALCAWRRIFPS